MGKFAEVFNPSRNRAAKIVAPFVMAPLILTGCSDIKQTTSISETTTSTSLNTTTSEKVANPTVTTILNTPTSENPTTTVAKTTTTTENTLTPNEDMLNAFKGLIAENITMNELNTKAGLPLARAKITQNTPTAIELMDQLDKVKYESSFRGHPYSMEFMVEKVAKKFFSRLESNGSYKARAQGEEQDLIYKGDLAGVIVGQKYVFLIVKNSNGDFDTFVLNEQTIVDSSVLTGDMSSKLFSLIEEGNQIDELLGIKIGDPIVIGIGIESNGDLITNEDGFNTVGSIVISGN